MPDLSKDYKKHFLKKVVFRIDYELTELVKLREYFDKKLRTKYPNQKIFKQRDGGFSFDLDTGNVNTETVNVYEGYEFTNDARSKIIQVTPKYIILEYLEYKKSSEFFSDIEERIAPLIETFRIKVLNRVGLRYINEIYINGIKEISGYKEYINGSLTNSIEPSSSIDMLQLRQMSQVIYRKSNDILSFNYGVWNNDFPSESLKPTYILDYDMYSVLPYNIEEINLTDKAREYRNKIRDMFEISISEKLRVLMK